MGQQVATARSDGYNSVVDRWRGGYPCRPRRSRTGLVRGAGIAVVLASLTSGLTSPQRVTATSTPGTAYTALLPFRACDTRHATSTECSGTTSDSLLGQGQSMTFQVTGVGPSGDQVPADAESVVLNVTAISGTAGTFLTVFPGGASVPTASNLNVPAQTNQANLVVVALGTGGQVSIYNSLGSINVAVDVEGYFAAPAGSSSVPGLFHPIPPLRICDTRTGTGTACSTKGPLGPGYWTKVVVSGCPTGNPSCGASVPDDGTAAAVALNLTAVSGTSSTYLSVVPPNVSDSCPSGAPAFSNLNVNAQTNLPNRVIVPLGPDRDVCVYNSLGSINFILDLNGWFGTGGEASPGAYYWAVTPTRICDTRSAAATGYSTECSGSPVGPAQSLPVQVAGVDGIPAAGGSTAPVAVIANVTAVSGTSFTYLTLYPADSVSVPNASDLNVSAYQNTPNLSIVQLAAGGAHPGALDLFNDLGTINAIVDVAGWFSSKLKPQAITFTSSAPSDAVVGGASYTPTASGGGSGNPVTFSIDPSSTAGCALSSGAVSFTAVGTCVVDANQAGNTYYSAAAQVQQSFTVGKRAQVISFTSPAPADALVGGATYTPTATATSGLPVAFTIDGSSTSDCSISTGIVSFPATPGSCIVDANQPGGTDYTAAPQAQQTFSVRLTQTISFTAPSSGTVKGSDALTPTASSGLTVALTVDASTTNDACSLSGDTVSYLHSGSCVLDANQAGDADHTAAAQVQQTIAVGQAAQTIAFTAPSSGMVNGSDVLAPTASSGLAVTLSVDASTTNDACSLDSDTVDYLHTGSCVLDAEQGGNIDYSSANQVKQTIAVGPATQTISFTAPSSGTMTGSATLAPTASSGLIVTLTVDTSTTDTACSLNGDTVNYLHTGDCVLDANQAGDADYNAASQVQQTITVSAAQLVFTTEPGGATAGSLLSPQPVVTIEDVHGTPITTDIGTVTLAITSGTGTSGALLDAGCTATTAAGVASFTGCEIDTAGTGYTLTATYASDGLTGASSAFGVGAGPASQLAFTTQPGGAAVGSPFIDQPVVTIEDGYGNPATSDTSTVILALTPGTGPSGADLVGCSGTTVAGVATFSSCEIDTVGTGYTLTATDTTDSLTATSSSFPVFTSSDSGTSSSSTGTATATTDSTTASAMGVGALTLGEYGSDPVGAPTFSSAGEYFDVALSPGNSFTTATINDCNLNGGGTIVWWNPAASGGSGAWQPVYPAPSYTAGPPACAAVTLTSSSSPTLAELTGTVFAAVTTPTLSWSQPLPIEGTLVSLTSVSCPSAHFCAAVDNQGNVLTYNGTSWTTPTSEESNAFSSVSCPSDDFCVAVDGGSGGHAGVATFNGTGWSTSTITDSGFLTSVSCFSASFCAAVDGYGNALTYDGSTWTAPADIDGTSPLVSVSCPLVSFCMAVDVSGNAFTSTGGDSWTASSGIVSIGSVNSLSCVSATYCMATTAYDTGVYGVGTSQVFNFDGSSWSVSTTINEPDLWTISCASTTVCMALEWDGYTHEFNDGIWSSSPTTVDIGSGAPSVSCASASFCAAVDNIGRALTFDGSSWTSLSNIDGIAAGLSAVSCPSMTFCAATDYDGRALTYNGTKWTTPTPIDGVGAGLSSVSCASSSFCLAVDAEGNAITFNGSGWGAPQSIGNGAALSSVSCPTDQFCAAADGGGPEGNMLTWVGSTGKWSTTPLSGTGPFSSVSCPSADFCVAVDGGGGGGGGGGANVAVWNGTTWTTSLNPDPNWLSSVSCSSTSFCAAVDGLLSALTFDGSSWTTPVTIDSTGGLESVSCPVDEFCAAVDGYGNVLTFDSGTWSTKTPVTSWGLQTVSCPSVSFCMALDGAGDVLYGTANGTTQMINFSSLAPTDAVVGGATYTPTATATSGLPVILTIDPSSSSGCAIADGVISFPTTAGTCVIDANQPGNADYSAAAQVQQSFEVGKESQTISFTSTAPTDAVVGGATYTPTATATSGLAVTVSLDGTSVGCTLSAGVVSFTAAGTCLLDANQAGNLNYSAAPQVQQPVTVIAGWMQLRPATSPSARADASITTLTAGPDTGDVMLFGGSDDSSGYLADTWVFNGSTWTQLSPSTSPPGRLGASMATLTAGPDAGDVVLFGGWDYSSGILADTWLFNGSTWTQLSPPTSPLARGKASMTTLTTGPDAGDVVLFGGCDNSGGYLGDTWVFDGSTWTQLSPLTSPPVRQDASMATVNAGPDAGDVILSGGYGDTGYLWDIWVFNGSTWTQLNSPTSFPARTAASMAAVSAGPDAGDVVLVGGYDSGYLGDTWIFDGSTWTQLSPATSPPGRDRASMATLNAGPDAGDVVLFGGWGGSDYVGDTWILGN